MFFLVFLCLEQLGSLYIDSDVGCLVNYLKLCKPTFTDTVEKLAFALS